MILPQPYQQHQEVRCPSNIGDYDWYDFRLDKICDRGNNHAFRLQTGDDYVFDIQFNTHPVLIDRNVHTDIFRTAVCDVDYINLIVDGEVVATLYNGSRNDLYDYSREVPGIVSESIDFFNGDPVIIGALHHGTEVTLRIVFWRPPICPFWITWNAGNVQPHERYVLQNPINVTDCNGRAMSYHGGMLGRQLFFGRY